MAQNPIEEVQILHTFTDKELQDLGTRIGSKFAEKENKEAEKKSVAAQYKADIDAINTQIKSLSNRINEGHESRTVAAEKVKNVEGKCWDYLDMNTRAILKSVPFQSKDFQGTQLTIDDQDDDADGDADGYTPPYNGPVFGDDDDEKESEDPAEAEEEVSLDQPEDVVDYYSDDDEVGYPVDASDIETEAEIAPEDPEEEPQSLGAAIEDLKAAKKKGTAKGKK